MHDTTFKTDLRELRFALFEHLDVARLVTSEHFSEFTPDVLEMVLAEAEKMAREVIGPANGDADRIGARFDDGAVELPRSMKQAWTRYLESDWHLLGVSREYGGQGLPHAVVTAVDEMWMGACPSFFYYPLLCRTSGRMIANLGTPEQKSLFAHRLFHGEWCGTMCLTEPGAGSDVGASTTRAVPQEDGTYLLSGSKCFVTAGDHDLTENIIHLVLARTDDAQPGTKGLSLFVVPKIWVEADGSLGSPNDVSVDGIEEKMGIHGSATCSVTFGRNGACRGRLLGGIECHGIRQMFQMMNEARLDVAVSGAAIAGASYQNALAYAKERVQGSRFESFGDPNAPKVAILEHPDVRRMLMLMKTSHESLRALCLWTSLQADLARASNSEGDRKRHLEMVELLTPVLKAYCTEVGFQMASIGISVLGGYGYCRDYPQEQYCRDAKIGTIYEGTNHIQSLDLVVRKLNLRDGKPFGRFLDLVRATIAEAQRAEALQETARSLLEATNALVEVRNLLQEAFAESRLALVPFSANRFCEMMGRVASGWMLLEQALVALPKRASLGASHPDHAFYAGKVAGAKFFAANVLPEVAASAEVVRRGDLGAVELDASGF